MAERLPRVKWPRSFPICALFGIAVALLLTAAAGHIQVRLMQPVQRLYFVSFLRVSALPFKVNLRLVEVCAPERGYIMAVDPWISVSNERNQLKISLTERAIKAGLTKPRLYVAETIKPQAIRPFFEHAIYHGNALTTFRPTMIAFFILFATGLLVGAWFDQQHQEAARRGIQIRGPRLIPARKAQKYLKGDGIALFLEPKTR